MSLRERKKQATRAALISTARRLFTEKGYENTTLDDICEVVQIHVATFFSYFGSKEELAFARTLEMLEMFRAELVNRPPETDVMTLFWNFMHEFSLQSRTEESAIMLRMDEVSALRNRYASIVREYEEEMATALAKEAGVDPETDLYSRLQAATLLSTVVATARWNVAMFGRRDVRGADPEVFPQAILSNFPSRAEIGKKQARFIAEVRKISTGKKRKPAATKPRKR